MIYPIIPYGKDILRLQAATLPQGTDLKALIKDMFATMDAVNGLGLAAPQIGKSIQLFVVNTSHWITDGATQQNTCRKVYINPIVEVPQPNTILYYEEGCLSIPYLYAAVPRNQKIRVRFFDGNWQPQEEELRDMPARVIQHEYDHLMGKLYIDYLPADERQALEKDLENIKKGKVQVSYSMQFK